MIYMSLAKGKLFITTEQIALMAGLPEGVEILAIKPSMVHGGFEFLLVSAEETDVTRKNVPFNEMRRNTIHVEVQPQPQPEKHTGMAQITFDMSGIKVENYNNVIKQDETDVKKIFENIVNNVKKNGSGF